MNNRVLNVAAIQQSCGLTVEDNRQTTAAHIRTAAGNGAQLIVLQELHQTRYFCQSENTAFFDLAEPIPGPGTDFFALLARELGVVIVTSLFEKRAPGLYHNTAVVLDSNGEIAGRYRKMHIPDDPGFYEKFYFTPGDLGFTPIQTNLGKLGILVCWDQWYPEAARLMALAGADLLIYPTAIGWDPHDDPAEQRRQLDAWITTQRAHAISNGIPVISCNRTGFEEDPADPSHGIQFWGNSFICGPQGEFIAQAEAEGDVILQADIELDRSEDVRRIWPYLRDRRIDAYDDLRKRFIDET